MTETETTPAEPLTIHQALIAVMREVTSLGKDGRNTSQGFSFRGIDATLNALGPVLRKYGVLPLPKVKQYDYTTIVVGAGGGRPMGHVSVVVEYTFVGPRGDSLSAEAAGEAMDAGDKATPKAMSVAMRTALLQTFALPTDEPDPDSYTYDRAPRESQAPRQNQQAPAQRPTSPQQGTTPPANRPAAQQPAQQPATVPPLEPVARAFVEELRRIAPNDDAAWRAAWKKSGELQLRAILIPTNAGPLQLGKLLMERMRTASEAARPAPEQGIPAGTVSPVDSPGTVAVSAG